MTDRSRPVVAAEQLLLAGTRIGRTIVAWLGTATANPASDGESAEGSVQGRGCSGDEAGGMGSL
jgi:hypothetical protein